ncbi:hypothetical protein LJC48_07970, partial [Desulfovibrio sp. OttesenSCG-928-C06]|nr:hypothetical protein [Desulfovibrio sp. OttesenSCG-928-C06]
MTFVLACAAQPSFAAGYNAGSFTANLPAGWTMTQDEEVTNFAEPSGPLELVILIKKYDDESIDDVVAEMAGQTPVQFLDANIYIYEDSSGSRGWCMLADDGTVADISTNMAYVNMKSFISGLNAAGDEPGLAEIFKALASSKQAADWLNYVTPAFADSEGGSDPGDTEDEGTLFEHKTFTATIPV